MLVGRFPFSPNISYRGSRLSPIHSIVFFTAHYFVSKIFAQTIHMRIPELTANSHLQTLSDRYLYYWR